MFLVRRTIFVIFTFTLISHPILQIELFIVVSLLYLCYINSKLLFLTRFLSRLETLNEVLFLLICYHLVLMANLVGEYATRIQIGWSLIYTSIAMAGINMIVILVANAKECIRKCKLKAA